MPGDPVSLTALHIAFPVDDLAAARTFYRTTLGCPEGRSSAQWIDFDLFGPCSHFGVVLAVKEWETLAERLRRAGVAFVIEPSIRFKAEVGEQPTMFFLDPAGNALEFKAFADTGQFFAK